MRRTGSCRTSRAIAAVATLALSVEPVTARGEETERQGATGSDGKQEEAVVGGRSGYLTPFETQLTLLQTELKKVTAFQFHGYLRAGLGQNSNGGNQVCFQDPGAPAKYRLGNECEDYSELVFAWDAYRPRPEGTYFRVNSRVAFDGGWLVRYQNVQFFAPELYVEAGSVLDGAMQNAKFWAGKRFYRKDEVHINDFYFWDMSGPGAGVEGIALGPGKLDLAYSRVANVTSDMVAVQVVNPDGTPKTSGGQPVLRTVPGMTLVQGNQVVSKGIVQWSQIAANRGASVDLGFEYRGLSGGRDGAAGDQGLVLHGMHTQKVWGGFNQLVAEYGRGIAANIGLAADLNAENDAQTFRVMDWLLVQPSRAISAAFVAIHQRAIGVQSQPRRWTSFGLRPIFNFTERARVAFEAGADFVDPGGGAGVRRLTKLTLAPELAVGRKFFDRPVLRVYVTYAHWNAAAAAADNGVVLSDSGTSPFARDRDGFTAGAQAEAWW